MNPTHYVLHIGCGNSLVAEHLYEHHIQKIKNIDFSEKVIKDMNQRTQTKGLTGLEYEVMDIFNLSYDDHTFNCVFDKGTLDAVFPENT